MKRLFETLTLVVLISTSNQISAQESTFADAKLYEAVINRLFQHQTHRQTSETQLRYTFCNSGEMQILIRNTSGDKVDVQVWHLPPDSATIWNQLAKLMTKTPTLDAEKAAGSINIQVESMTIPKSDRLQKLIEDGYSLSVPLTGDDTLILDGMTYGLQITFISRNLSINIQAPQKAIDSENPVVRWMGQVRSEVERQAGAPPSTGRVAQPLG